jgi:hypothetical protein
MQQFANLGEQAEAYLLQAYVGHVSCQQLLIGCFVRGNSFLMRVPLLHNCLCLLVLAAHMRRKALWLALLSFPALIGFQSLLIV